MRLQSIDRGFLIASSQIRAGVVRSEVTLQLGEYLFVLACGEFQAELQSRMRALNLASLGNPSWVKARVDCDIARCFGGPQEKRGSGSLHQMRAFCDCFGRPCRQSFDSLLAADQQAQASYESLFNNRNNIAHGGPRSVTLRDALTYYWSGHRVIDYAIQAVAPYMA